jgi:hypothetical protein
MARNSLIRPWQPPRNYTSGGPVTTIQVPGGGGRGGLGSSYAQALRRANQANEKRYRQLLSGYDSLRRRTMGTLSGIGQQEGEDIAERYRDVNSINQQNLVSRGLAGSSVAGTMRLGAQREMNKDMRRLQQGLAGQRVSADIGISQGRLGVMERRFDRGPDLNQMIALAQAVGRGGGGQFGGFGGGGIGLGFGGGTFSASQLAQLMYRGGLQRALGLATWNPNPIILPQGLQRGRGGRERRRFNNMGF